MSDLLLNRLSVPIVTGTPVRQPTRVPTAEENGQSFLTILQNAQNNRVEFSKHAATRVAERNIQLSENSLTRLNEGVRIAQEKGLNDTLILIDRTAFIVNVKSSKVITTVDSDHLMGNVFTNIDGTVII